MSICNSLGFRLKEPSLSWLWCGSSLVVGSAACSMLCRGEGPDALWMCAWEACFCSSEGLLAFPLRLFPVSWVLEFKSEAFISPFLYFPTPPFGARERQTPMHKRNLCDEVDVEQPPPGEVKSYSITKLLHPLPVTAGDFACTSAKCPAGAVATQTHQQTPPIPTLGTRRGCSGWGNGQSGGSRQRCRAQGTAWGGDEGTARPNATVGKAAGAAQPARRGAPALPQLPRSRALSPAARSLLPSLPDGSGAMEPGCAFCLLCLLGLESRNPGCGRGALG